LTIQPIIGQEERSRDEKEQMLSKKEATHKLYSQINGDWKTAP